MDKIPFLTIIILPILFCVSLLGQCPGSQTFNSDGTWTAPSSGGPFTVIITCNGAGGGNGANSRVGGSGAQTLGTFTVQNGEVLNVIVGQSGNNNTGPGGGGGAGGGSAVINCGNPSNCAGGTLLIAAAGGGGAGAGGNGGAGLATQGSGDPGACDPAGGGGGLNGSSSCSGREGGQASFTATSSGGIGSNNGGNGGNGFGGGGSGYFGVGGGGGGHSGGRGGPGGGGGNGPGQGGESFNTGTNPSNTSGGGATATNNGSVVINCITGLPVEMRKFTAIKERNDVLLTWQTASETNNEGFEVQWAMGSSKMAVKDWETIGFEKGQGSFYDLNTYQFLHEFPASGINYYRLKQIDYDGSFEYSDVESVQFPVGFHSNRKQLTVSPNPVSVGFFNLSFLNDDFETGELSIYNSMGRLVQSQTIWDLNTEIQTEELVKGVYLVSLEINGQRFFEQIIVQ